MKTPKKTMLFYKGWLFFCASLPDIDFTSPLPHFSVKYDKKAGCPYTKCGHPAFYYADQTGLMVVELCEA